MRQFLCAVLMLSAVGSTAQAGPILSWEGGASLGNVSYSGDSQDGLTGTGIRIDTLTGFDTPANDAQSLNLSLLSGRLNFETGAFLAGFGPTATFDAGGSFTLTGAIFALGIFDPGTTLFSGTFTDEVSVTQTGGGLIVKSLSGEGGLTGTVNPLLTSYYGTSNLPYTGSITLDFAALGLGSLANGFISTGTNQVGIDVSPVPEPSTLALASIGILGIGLARYRRRK